MSTLYIFNFPMSRERNHGPPKRPGALRRNARGGSFYPRHFLVITFSMTKPRSRNDFFSCLIFVPLTAQSCLQISPDIALQCGQSCFKSIAMIFPSQSFMLIIIVTNFPILTNDNFSLNISWAKYSRMISESNQFFEFKTLPL